MHHVAPALCHIANLSIQEGKFPSCWKTFKIISIYKQKGDKSDSKNQRPVALLSVLSKVVESLVYNQLVDYLMENNLFHTNHHGFRSNHSTATALLHLYDLWIKALDSKQFAAALMLDLSAGFDVVNHPILLSKLSMYGLDELSVSWFRSYLTDIQQCVQVESVVSNPLAVSHGVPQGSILGPLLFLIYIMDMPEAVETYQIDNNSHTVIYADDNTPTTCHQNIDILGEKIQADADQTTSWIRDKKMICSGEKTKLLVIGTEQNRRINMVLKNKEISVNVCGKEILESTSEKLLGVIINNNATWKHMLYGNNKVGKDKEIGLIKQLSKRVGILKRVRRYMPGNRFRIVANSMFNSKLIY